MKRRMVVFGMLCVMGLGSYSGQLHAGPATTQAAAPAPATIALSPERKEYAPGESVVLVMHIRNVGDQEVEIGEYLPPPRARVTCDGRLLERTPESIRQEKLAEDLPGSRFGTTLFPGDTIDHRLLLWKQYDLSVPGNYRVVIEHPVKVAGSAKLVIVRSDEASFRVVGEKR